MGYSIYQEPAQIQPAYNDLIFVVSSTNSSQINFNYLATIHVGGDVITLKAPANPTYGSGVFNFGRIVESYIGSDIDKSTYGFQRNSNSYIQYQVYFGEEYGASGTQYTNLEISEPKYVWNGIVDFLNFQSYTSAPYRAESGSTLSRSIDRYIELTQDAWLYYITKTPTTFSKAIVNAYNSSNALIRAVEVANPYQTSGTIGDHAIRFSSGANNLNNILSGATSGYITDTYSSGLIIPATTYKYTVQFDGGGSSPTYTYYITTPCKYSTYRLHFLNEKGAFESFNFTKLSKKSTDIVRSNYKAPYGSLTTSRTCGYNKSDRLDRTFFISLKDGLSLKSDWITEDEYDWLEELITSPEIYLDDPTHGLVAVTCKVDKYDVKTVLNDKLFNLSIDLTYSFNRYRQRY